MEKKDYKILGLVLVGLFLIFLITGGITGEATRRGLISKLFGSKKISAPTFKAPTTFEAPPEESPPPTTIKTGAVSPGIGTDCMDLDDFCVQHCGRTYSIDCTNPFDLEFCARQPDPNACCAGAVK